MHVCVVAMADDTRVTGSNAALHCGFDGCELNTVGILLVPSQVLFESCLFSMLTKFHLECINFDCAQKGVAL